MKKNIRILTFLLLVTFLVITIFPITNSIGKEETQNEGKKPSNDTNAFTQIYGSPGYTALAVSEEDNLIFTNSYKGLAFFQLDDLSNSTHYGVEIGLSEATIFDLEVDPELKLLYISTVGNVDVLNYSKTPLQAKNIISGNFGVFELTKNVIVDPETHYAWIASNNWIKAYDPISESFVDLSAYDLPTEGITTIELKRNAKTTYLFIGTENGLIKLKVDDPNYSAQIYDTTDGLPYNKIKMIKHYPGGNRVFLSTVDSSPNSGLYGGLSVLFLDNDTTKNYNLTELGFNPLPVIDLTIDNSRGLGYIASFISGNTESGLYIFDIDTLEGVARSAQGTYGSSNLPFITSNYEVEGLLASVELNNITKEVIIGSIQRLQILNYTTPGSSTITSGPILGLYHNLATDVHYDSIDHYMYISTLLGLDRIDIFNANQINIEHLINTPGAGGNTAGELLEESRLMFHHQHVYNISHGTTHELRTILPLDEYNHIVDISSSPNESVVYYSVSTDENGNGSLIIYNWESGYYSVHDLGYDKTLLKIREVLHYSPDNVLYIATNKGLVLFDLDTLTVSKTYGESENWDVTSLTLIDGKVWLGLENNPHIKILNPTDETFTDFTEAAAWIPTINDIIHITETNEIVFTTNRGFYVYNMTNEEIKWEGEEQGLSSLFVARVAYCPETK
ncbi:MAG: hypothetical protein ACTSPI_16630, partial [Candidatus Heimdallarchaeaceae archaeon]